MKSGIYQIICLKSGKSYIGSTVDIKRRWKFHRMQLNKNIHENKYLQNSWNKYSKEYFEFVVIEYCERETLIQKEQYYLDYIKPEFNIRKTAESNLGLKHTEEWKKKHSLRMIGNTRGKGRIVSIETRNKISKLLIGGTHNKLRRKFPDEWIREIRTSKLSNEKLAKEYSCCSKEIWQIKNYKMYQDVE